MVTAIVRSPSGDGLRSGKALPRAGWVCPRVPTEIVRAAGMAPLRLARGVSSTGLADRHLPATVCPLLRGVLDAVLGGAADPQLIVLAETCEGIKRLADILHRVRPGIPVITVDVPHRSDDSAVAYLASGFRSMTARLAAESGRRITDDDVAEQIRAENGIRARLRILLERRRAGVIGIPDEDWMTFVEAVRADPAAADLGVPTKGRSAGHGPDVLMIGGFMDEPSLLRHLSESGARMADEDLCVGFRWAREDVATSGDPFGALAEHDLVSMSCPRSLGPAYLERLRSLASGVSGVIALKPKFCDVSHLAFLRERRLFRSIGLPVLLLEADGGVVMNGQAKTRVSAFLEMLP